MRYAIVRLTIRRGVTISVRCKVLNSSKHFGRTDYLLETNTGSTFWASEDNVSMVEAEKESA